MSKITVIGAGHVGLVTGACFADLGNSVICVDVDKVKIALLQDGGMPIYEPGLQELTARNHKAGRLNFTTSYKEGLADADFVFIAVNTPEGVEGEADMRSVRMAAENIGQHLNRYTVVVNKSTMPVGAGDKVVDIIRGTNPKYNFDVVSNPEFLREGQAVHDFQQPDRVVIGANNRKAAEGVATLYGNFKCPVIITDLRAAEM
ncbi:MAG: UDP-glucose/GDP-mannose dehydrogenase family protein, partial [Dehalococcoidia bacterium]|nr:UDP-glucose/GDP-mannose dehydrogenase family protein [Dehalococcoidia bacterium]